MSNVFYQRSGEPAAHRVANALRAAGHQVWTDEELPPHRAYSEVIEERLQSADAVVVLWSEAAAKSEWVRAEAEYARGRRRLVQIVLDDSLPPLPFNQTQCVRLKGWNGDQRNSEWRKVLESLSQLDPSGSAPGAAQGAPPPEVGGRAPSTGGRPRWQWGLGLAAALIAILAGGLWITFDLRQRQLSLSDPRTVVLPFKALSGGQAVHDFAALADSELAGKLSENQFRILAPSHARDADLAITGTVQGDGDKLHVRASLEDPRAGATLWSAEFERPAAEAAGLRSEVGWRLNDVLTSALIGRRSGRGRLGSAELGLYIRSRDALAASDIEPRPLVEELIRRAPDFAPAHASLCMQILGSARYAATADFVAQRTLGVAECRRALELDPRLGLPRRGLSYAEDGRQWARREMQLRPAGANAGDPDLSSSLGELMTQAGRQDEGVTLLQAAAAARKGWTIDSSNLAFALMESDRTDEAREFIAHRLALRPTDGDMQALDFLIVAFRGAPDKALAILDDPARRHASLPPPAVKAFRAFLQARRTGSQTDRKAAVATILETAGISGLRRSDAVAMLMILGDLDSAFRVAEAYASDPLVVRFGNALLPAFLFGPETAAMRQDPRFIPIMERLGLVDYWRTSGHWPDFCTKEPKSICSTMQRQPAAG